MIYSIGYQKHTKETLIEELRRRQVEVLIDVRSKPFGYNPSFRRPALESWIQGNGIRYIWRGDVLGGFAAIPDSALKWLAKFGEEKTVCIMCMESDPDKCHRKTEIARRLQAMGFEVDHIQADRP